MMSLRTAACALALLLPLVASPASAGPTMILATTTSTDNSGLLDDLLPAFEDRTGIDVKPVAVGTGAALRMATKGQADAVLTHAPSAEKPLVDAGDLIEGRRIMHNDFVLVGPADDPAGAKQDTLATSLRAIATHGSFVSRGDDSGTHKRELALWALADIDPTTLPKREETGQGMGATLDIASERRSYTLTDRGTYLALLRRLDLEVIFEGEPPLLNVYSIYVVNPEKHPGAKADLARQLAAYFAEPEIQARIGEFRREEYGRPLFVPDVVPSSKEGG
ncbi:MAG: substrate-binding domain-containing protein [Candidatus Binatia bacterium]|nr:substrate-binding domain-containing protein [Candidatus Binatia bacterium]